MVTMNPKSSKTRIAVLSVLLVLVGVFAFFAYKNPEMFRALLISRSKVISSSPSSFKIMNTGTVNPSTGFNTGSINIKPTLPAIQPCQWNDVREQPCIPWTAKESVDGVGFIAHLPLATGVTSKDPPVATAFDPMGVEVKSAIEQVSIMLKFANGYSGPEVPVTTNDYYVGVNVKNAKNKYGAWRIVVSPNGTLSDGKAMSSVVSAYTMNIVIKGPKLDLTDDQDAIPTLNSAYKPVDNCYNTFNPYDVDTNNDGVFDAQKDTDRDGHGDVCQNDWDSDGVPNAIDNCREIPNVGQADMDKDRIGDPCDDDRDGDGISNGNDNCPDVANPNNQTPEDASNICPRPSA